MGAIARPHYHGKASEIKRLGVKVVGEGKELPHLGYYFWLGESIPSCEGLLWARGNN